MGCSKRNLLARKAYHARSSLPLHTPRPRARSGGRSASLRRVRPRRSRLLRTGPPAFVLNIDRPETQFAPDQDMYAPEVYARAAELLARAYRRRHLHRRREPRVLYLRAHDGRPHADGPCGRGALSMSTRTAPSSAMSSRARTRNATRIDHMRALGCQTGPHLPHLSRPARAGHHHRRGEGIIAPLPLHR